MKLLMLFLFIFLFPLCLPIKIGLIGEEGHIQREELSALASPEKVVPDISELPLAPFLPLSTEFPLQLSAANRAQFIDGAEAQEEARRKIQNALEKHKFPWIPLFLLIGGGGVGWFFYLVRDRFIILRKKAQPIRSPRERIDEELRLLEQSSYIAEQPGKYYGELASSLYRSVEAYSGWMLHHLTTDEFIRKTKDLKDLFSAQGELMLALFQEIDQVKFGGKVPTAEEAERAGNKVLKILSYLKEKSNNLE